MSTTSEISFVYSSFTDFPEDQFRGYCFVGPDYIYGADGREKFENETGNRLTPGLDGCYAIATATSDGVEVGVDAGGMAKLFYYHKDNIWAFGDSLSGLVDHLRMNGINPEPNIPQLAAMGWLSTFTSQVCSFSTIFSDITLLASGQKLIVTRSGIRTIDLPRPTLLPYKHALEVFMSTWVARIRTLLMCKDLVLSSDLTGGIDSRTIFALLAAATKEPTANRPYVRSSTLDYWRSDLQAAEPIARAYGIELNTDIPRPALRSTGEETFERWRATCLGTYLSVYLRPTRQDPLRVHLDGGGGENFRFFYPEKSLPTLLDKFSGRLPESWYGQWRHEVETSVSYLKIRTPDAPDSILHYREFRNRFHTGRSPHFSVFGSPMASGLLKQFSAPLKFMDGRQIYFDIMESLAPGLMNFEYDKAGKGPAPSNLQDLTVARVSQDIEGGHAYFRSPTKSKRSRQNRRSAIDHFLEAAQNSLESPQVKEFLTSTQLRKGDEALAKARERGKFDHASHGKPLSYAISVAYALNA